LRSVPILHIITLPVGSTTLTFSIG